MTARGKSKLASSKCKTMHLLNSAVVGALCTCEVQTLLKETKMAVCRKQQKTRSEWKAHDATNSRMSCGRNAARPSHWLHLLSAPTKDKRIWPSLEIHTIFFKFTFPFTHIIYKWLNKQANYWCWQKAMYLGLQQRVTLRSYEWLNGWVPAVR